MRLRRSVSLTVILAIAVVIAINWQAILLGGSMILAESRPALLADANWNDPSTAKNFNARFAPGTKSNELVAWLRGNDFEIQAGKGRAERKVSSLPCNERVVVSWQSDAGGRIAERRAIVTESGCL